MKMSVKIAAIFPVGGVLTIYKRTVRERELEWEMGFFV